MDLNRLIIAAAVTPYAERGDVPVTEAAWSALARCKVVKGRLVLGGEAHGFVKVGALYVLAAGEGSEVLGGSGPTDPDPPEAAS